MTVTELQYDISAGFLRHTVAYTVIYVRLLKREKLDVDLPTPTKAIWLVCIVSNHYPMPVKS